MGDVIKDFQDSDAPQFKGKSDEKRRQMAIAAKLSNEEVESLDELSKKTLAKYIPAAAKDAERSGAHQEYYGSEQDYRDGRNRQKGIERAVKKLAKEEAEVIDEGRMKEIVMDINSMGDKDFKSKHKKSKQEMQSALKSEELKGDQHKIDANKNGKVDGHDFKILRNAKKARYQ